MIKYTYKIEYKDHDVIFDFNQDHSLEFASLLTDCLGPDLSWRIEDLKEDMNYYMNVLKGNIPEYGHGGNATIVRSYQDYTIIEDLFYDEEEDEIEPSCKLETIEFVKIILLWAYETYRYKSEKKTITPSEAEIAMAWIEEKRREVDGIENASKV